MAARGMSSEAVRKRVPSDVAKWTQVLDKAGIAKR